MRWFRITGLILVGWAVAFTVYAQLGVRSWFRTQPPSPFIAELRERNRREAENMALWSGSIGVTCLALASLLGRHAKDPAGSGAIYRMIAAGPPDEFPREEAGSSSGHGAGAADAGPRPDPVARLDRLAEHFTAATPISSASGPR
jgi:hypothetical protein